MDTNERAQLALKLVHDLTGDLYTASKDGKIDVSEATQALIASLPTILSMIGQPPGKPQS